MVKNWAISIGINYYDNLRPLKYAERDANLFGEFLKQEAKFDEVFYFSDHSSKIVRPNSQPILSQPKFTNLLRALRTLTKKKFMGVGDNFWFFFSGHGRRRNQRDFLMLSDSDPGNVEKTAIAVSDVVESLRNCGAGNIILILDACRDNPGDKGGEGIGTEAQQGVITFFSCSPQEQSWEIEELQQSSFTHALLEGLRLKGDNNCATAKRLDNYLREKVPQVNSQYKKPLQNPYTVAEPAKRYYSILLPHCLSVTHTDINTFKTDIDALRIEAYKAEVTDKDLELAYQLWHQVLAATYGLNEKNEEAENNIDRLRQLGLVKQQESQTHEESQGAKSGNELENDPVFSTEILREKLNSLPFKRQQVLKEILGGRRISEVARNLDMTESAVNYNLIQIYKYFKINSDFINEINGKKLNKKSFLIALFKKFLPESVNYFQEKQNNYEQLIERLVNPPNDVDSETFADFKPVDEQPKKNFESVSEETNNGNQVEPETFASHSQANLGDDEGYLISTKTEPINILILAANPKNTSRLDLEKEVREVSEILRNSREDIDFEIQERWAVRFRDLRQALLEIEPHVVHFSGHGSTDGIFLEDEEGNAYLVSQEALVGLFELFKNKIVCVFLNACYTGIQSEAINKYVSYVVGMSQVIGDRAAIVFSVAFYEALTNGRSLEFAYKLGCNAIHGEIGNEYLTPVLKRNNAQYQALQAEGRLSSAPPSVSARNSQQNLSKILVLASNPRGTSTLRTNEEIREIRNEIRGVRGCSFSLENRWAIRIRDFHKAMLELKPEIVHFSGHGAGRQGIVFENDQGREKFIEPDALARLFKPYARYVKCVLINASYSEVHALALAQYIDYVIGMIQPISDQTAIAFSSGFYRALAYQSSVENAFELGCSEIADKLPGTQEHLIPKLYGKKISKPQNHSSSDLYEMGEEYKN
ncbi:MAG: caspase family protein [Pelatocladus maniniholoensis HA4357-MV3]|jgi:hypothetical protein|uniref:Caspase family protein n=1 Tax=Pelatocladus maniniholoensis HA4357-MV3 TaxID=1117104 RepID=A0A9E3HFM9_9NOST|nr:caspase family protein [Pelatocladus maniniholoensis HA4357-MV3]BAZ67297.1 hypothetical protein NIES4106_20520 [Fischerella sp. NIES-4106]